VVEGTVATGQEAYSDFLINRTRFLSGISNKQRELIELYIALKYGNLKTPRIVPYVFAKRHNILDEAIKITEAAAYDMYKQKRLEYVDRAKADFTRGIQIRDKIIRRPRLKQENGNWQVSWGF
jgi:hypothetical protein